MAHSKMNKNIQDFSLSCNIYSSKRIKTLFFRNQSIRDKRLRTYHSLVKYVNKIRCQSMNELFKEKFECFPFHLPHSFMFC